ncbi:Rap family tetratricopeptide repeat protein [Bacillus pumilus]|uniref:response regulator aspartate phosphatase n=1 Tax=Bacillus TaxID=1386 RepID=UPI000681F900|nr:tetratricopeptide repeat protein [Bacillus pumilus]KMY20059.1 aspartate phosphatase [Bacillus pumilus]MCI4617244.1 tetratricopeptide repeat protein [Bacillus pumilus]MCM3148665.1 tetratricopeptide repeat protein [Bacillus pumilus]MDR6746160.1 response regulator aspartate phosphatase H [Bacillus pumilus]
MEKVLSSHVGVKINEWYKMIRQFSVPDAEILKAEVEQEIERMEEDQDLLIYYQLMCFRHQIMLDYIKPVDFNKNRPTISSLLDLIETSQETLTGMLEYYNLFFRGMYEFSNKEYVEAIKYYRKAEIKLEIVSDEIERAEFHFKVAEAYYMMKQTHVSMHHILKAMEIYDQYDLYKVRKIQCSFVIAGNYDDMKRSDKALPHLEKSLRMAEEIQNNRLISSAYYNLADCYECLGDTDQAIAYCEKAVRINKNERYDNLPHSLYFLSSLLMKKGDYKKGKDVLDYGFSISVQYDDDLYKRLFHFIKALYVDKVNIDQIKQVFHFLDENKIYAYLEELSYDVAGVFKSKNDHETANEFLMKMLDAQTKILKGDCLYEY